MSQTTSAGVVELWKSVGASDWNFSRPCLCLDLSCIRLAATSHVQVKDAGKLMYCLASCSPIFPRKSVQCCHWWPKNPVFCHRSCLKERCIELTEKLEQLQPDLQKKDSRHGCRHSSHKRSMLEQWKSYLPSDVRFFYKEIDRAFQETLRQTNLRLEGEIQDLEKDSDETELGVPRLCPMNIP